MRTVANVHLKFRNIFRALLQVNVIYSFGNRGYFRYNIQFGVEVMARNSLVRQYCETLSKVLLKLWGINFRTSRKKYWRIPLGNLRIFFKEFTVWINKENIAELIRSSNRENIGNEKLISWGARSGGGGGGGRVV